MNSGNRKTYKTYSLFGTEMSFISYHPTICGKYDICLELLVNTGQCVLVDNGLSPLTAIVLLKQL